MSKLAAALSTRDATGKSKQDWATPRWFFKEHCKRQGYRYTLDVCANRNSTVCERYFNSRQNGLSQEWRAGFAWCNPPWADPLPWILKAEAETSSGILCGQVTMLLPVKVETKWFRELWRVSERIEIIYPRLNYYDGRVLTSGIAFASCLAYITGQRLGKTPIVTFAEYRKPKGARR